MFDAAAKQAGKKYHLIPYFIAAHPGTTNANMLQLALWLKKNRYRKDGNAGAFLSVFDRTGAGLRDSATPAHLIPGAAKFSGIGQKKPGHAQRR